MDIESIKNYWLAEAEEVLDVAGHLIEKGDNSYALFFGHLAVEKLLKALYVAKQKDHAPPIHNLNRLARLAGIEIDDEKKKDALVSISAFNIEARYPDIKRVFRKKCTGEYTERQLEIIKEVFQWLKEQLP